MKQFALPQCWGLFCFCLIFGAATSAAETPDFDETSLEFFEKQVRPILIARCYECHSQGKGSIKGGLSLDSRDAILKGGDTGPAVTLEKPATSLLLSAINYGDLYQMPPKSKLPAQEIAVLTKWVEQGLPWPKEASAAQATVKAFNLEARAAEHWCWQPVKDTAAPVVNDSLWPISDIDRFILARLESRGLKPAPSADRSTLLRRVYFDLIGLPPAPQDVEDFVHSQDPQALEKVVDRLLGSDHFGERWARHWLDLTRYGETRGHEFDPIIPNAWQYRDYVIRAFNADVPYDRFLVEQLAGDLIEPRWREGSNSTASLPINEAPLGTGFWFLGEEVHSPVDIRKDETDRMDNRLDVLSKTFLGLTVACARCHDHKFDAISQRDYYALAGFAISGSYRQIRVETNEQHRQIARQLDELRSKSRQEMANAISQSVRPVIDKLDQYWLVAKRVIDEVAAGSNAATGVAPSSEELAKRCNRLAAENSVDPGLLIGWCRELIAANKDPLHPLHRLFDSSAAGAAADPDSALTYDNFRDSYPGIVVDFGARDTAFSIEDGVSFGLRPVKRGQLELDTQSDSPSVRIATVGGWQRDLFWKNLALKPGTELESSAIGGLQLSGRMVRSPEFTLTHRNLWYLVRGSVNVYASVNSHIMINGPLHGSLVKVFKQTDDQWRWVHQPMDLYQGHRMHVEFSPADAGPCSVAMILQSDKPPQLPKSNWTGIGSAGQTIERKLTAYQDEFRQAAKSIAVSADNDLAAKHDSSPQRWALADWMVTHLNLFTSDSLQPILNAQRDAEAQLTRQVQWDSSLAPAMLDANGVDEYFLVRGNSNTPKEPVSRRFLEVFQGTAQHRPSSNGISSADDRNPSSGRLELAREILRSPLASRVAVNRIWHHLFGRGIVATVDNMGLLGLPPSHPELLDHLAVHFVREGWSMKSMIRSLVLSRTYQMSSQPTDADAVDPNNELWHRMPIKRLEGEIIRDSLLAVSGRLDAKLYGPSVPIFLTEFMQGRGRPGQGGPLDGNGRRSIYISVRRNFLSPMMLAFDTPSPFSTVGRRTVSNVPSQALILMNDPFVILQAKTWAERLLSDSSLSTQQRLDRMYMTAFARHPSSDESSEAINFLEAQIQNRPENQLDAWSNLCHVMFNVKEFVFID